MIGVSLGGDEARFPAKLFVDAFAYARAQRTALRRACRRGRWAGERARRRRAAARAAHRARHSRARRREHRRASCGRGAFRSRSVRRRTGLPVRHSPTIPIRTSISIARGCIVTIDCDDPTLFPHLDRARVCARRGGRRVGRAGALRAQRHRRVVRRRAEKRAMEAQLAAAVAELPVAPRS